MEAASKMPIEPSHEPTENQRFNVMVVLTRCLIFLATPLLIAGMMVKSLGGTGFASWFSYHPVFMTLAFVFAMSSGILSYFDYENRSAQRFQHAIYQCLACVFVILGFIAIWVAHAQGKKSQFGGGDIGWRKKAHVYIGYVVVLLTLLQVFVGLVKYAKITKKKQKWAKFHGISGPIIYLFGMVNVLIAVSFWWHFDTLFGGLLGALVLAITGCMFVVILKGKCEKKETAFEQMTTEVW
eukprot:g3917.t1